MARAPVVGPELLFLAPANPFHAITSAVYLFETSIEVTARSSCHGDTVIVTASTQAGPAPGSLP